MKLSAVKKILLEIQDIHFQLENGTRIPENFHITEIGNIEKNFIDCGGKLRQEKVINFQLWSTDDQHRLSPKKFADIIQLSETKLALEDREIEVEYQGETIGKYDLDFDGNAFILKNKMTDCLAKDRCGVPEKPKVQLSALGNNQVCTPGSGCC